MRKIKTKYWAIILVHLVLVECAAQLQAQTISLAGNWKVSLSGTAISNKNITLPGVLDDAGIGIPVQIATELNLSTLAHLTRKVQFTGEATYERKIFIPDTWKGKKILLTLERVLWRSKLMINSKQVPGVNESISTPHFFDLTNFVKPGAENVLAITIDNSNIYPGINITSKTYPAEESKELAHAYTNHTQIKWNGILGRIEICAKPLTHITAVTAEEDRSNNRLKITVNLDGALKNQATVQAWVSSVKNQIPWAGTRITGAAKNGVYAGAIKIPANAERWNEFNPVCYQLYTVVKSNGGADTSITRFALRDLKSTGSRLTLNDERLFIRGNLECIIFPDKGYPPTTVQAWYQLFQTAKRYGLNSFRFHSWCPPEAAFAAADSIGFYLQAELPHWNLEVGKDDNVFRFLKQEAKNILKAYGNHPSFMFFSMGNELEGDFDKLNSLVKELRTADNRHLYATTSFTFQKGITKVPQPEDDFFITQYTKEGWVRGQGIFNSETPDFSRDYRATALDTTVPLISHEIGQYSVYPDLAETELYQGNLVPKNFLAIANDLKKKKLHHLAPAFLNASGQLAAILYKEEIERALKTKNFNGFQLLQLQDFPGQGTALVGLLNAFWKSKGIITAEEFNSFCSELVPLARFKSAVLSNTEVFKADIELANFYKPLKAQAVNWMLLRQSGAVLAAGVFETKDYAVDNGLHAGNIAVPLDAVKRAEKLSLKVSVAGTEYHNSWPLWVYPAELPEVNAAVTVTDNVEEALNQLNAGNSVLLAPKASAVKGQQGKFVPVFWSPVHFPDQPGTMGFMINNHHAALSHFPTDAFTNWQWWPLAVTSKAVAVDGLSDDANIVRPIDNFVTNANLTSLFEVRVGRGKLMFCAFNLNDETLQAKQLKYSLLQYMSSSAFHPTQSFHPSGIRSLVNPQP